jgi:hypothetical protein
VSVLFILILLILFEYYLLAIETPRNDDTSEREVARLNAEIGVVVELIKKNLN